MCGIGGIVTGAGLAADELEAQVRLMIAQLSHRGPDGDGVWSAPDFGVCLGHRRLSILDLSENGRQPMASASGRYQLTYNGEIYNFVALREELAANGARFRGGSDTEVLLAAVDAWGLLGALERANGMFAFALWDGTERRLHLGRDRLGKKPLYWGWLGERLAFGSELKALRALPGFEASVDRDSLAAYLRFNAVPATGSIFSGISKIEPGTVRSFDFATQARPEGEVIRYWDPTRVVDRARAAPINHEAEAIDTLDALLRDAVRIRLESDVPLGAFLSGGVDSTLVVALMQAQSARPTRTFTIGFHVDGYDEATHAAAVAKHLGTDHTELYLRAEDARAVIPELPQVYDEPFCDVSQIPTLLVSRLARRHVTVCLSGDGGDELFTGYPRYPFASRLWDRFDAIPRRARALAGRALGGLSASRYAQVERALRPLRHTRVGSRANVDRLYLFAQLLEATEPDAFYRTLLSHWREPSGVVLGARASGYAAAIPPDVLRDVRDRASFLDMVGYLPDDILVKVDRATMAVSLEARAPLLDWRVAELAWRMPLSLKLRDSRQKWILQQLVWRYVPKALMDRPKMGFGVPIGAWLRGPLRPWAEDLLSRARLRRDGYFDPDPIRRRWHEHVTGIRSWAPELWAVLMFQAWLDSAPSPARGARPPSPARVLAG